MYEAPEILELGKIKVKTRGPSGGNFPDGGEDLFFRFIWPIIFIR